MKIVLGIISCLTIAITACSENTANTVAAAGQNSISSSSSLSSLQSVESSSVAATAEPSSSTPDKPDYFTHLVGKWIDADGTYTSELSGTNDKSTIFLFPNDSIVYEFSGLSTAGGGGSGSFSILKGSCEKEDTNRLKCVMNYLTDVSEIPQDSIFLNWGDRISLAPHYVFTFKEEAISLSVPNAFSISESASYTIIEAEPYFDASYLTFEIDVDKDNWVDSLVCEGFDGNTSYFPIVEETQYIFSDGTFNYIEGTDCNSVTDCTAYIYLKNRGLGLSYSNDSLMLYGDLVLIDSMAKGKSWDYNESEYLVKATDETFSSYFCDYTDLLYIQRRDDDGGIADILYKKGLGMVYDKYWHKGKVTKRYLMQVKRNIPEGDIWATPYY
ncbi:MAG: hypothetical protein OCD01_05305 [Fibrobacterales bacterium]